MSYHYEVCYVLTLCSAVNLILLDFWLYLTLYFVFCGLSISVQDDTDVVVRNHTKR